MRPTPAATTAPGAERGPSRRVGQLETALLGDAVAAIHDDDLAVDVGGAGAGEPGDRRGHLIGGARAARRGGQALERLRLRLRPRGDPAGCHGIHRDAVPRLVHRRARVSPTSPALAAAYATSPRMAISAPVTLATMTTSTVSAAAQVRQRGTGHEEGGVEVPLQGLMPALGRGGKQVALEEVRLGGRDHAGVVDDDVDVAEGRERLVDEHLRRVGVGEVADEGARGDVLRQQVLAPVVGAAAGRAHHHAGTEQPEVARGCVPDACAAGPGDDRDAAGEVQRGREHVGSLAGAGGAGAGSGRGDPVPQLDPAPVLERAAARLDHPA